MSSQPLIGWKGLPLTVCYFSGWDHGQDTCKFTPSLTCKGLEIDLARKLFLVPSQQAAISRCNPRLNLLPTTNLQRSFRSPQIFTSTVVTSSQKTLHCWKAIFSQIHQTRLIAITEAVE